VIIQQYWVDLIKTLASPLVKFFTNLLSINQAATLNKRFINSDQSDVECKILKGSKCIGCTATDHQQSKFYIYTNAKLLLRLDWQWKAPYNCKPIVHQPITTLDKCLINHNYYASKQSIIHYNQATSNFSVHMSSNLIKNFDQLTICL